MMAGRMLEDRNKEGSFLHIIQDSDIGGQTNLRLRQKNKVIPGKRYRAMG